MRLLGAFLNFSAWSTRAL